MPPLQSLRPIFSPDLSAKIRWRMRFDRNPLLVTIQDKFAVQEYAQERGVRCAPLLHVTEDPRTIPFCSLPPNCMIKATHGWNWNIVRVESRFYPFGDGRLLVGHGDMSTQPGSDGLQQLTIDEVIATCENWLALRHRTEQWAYQHMTPRILIEEMLRPRDGRELLDFRLYTFRGRVSTINIGSSRFRRDKVNVFLRPDWSVIPLTRYRESLPSTIPPRPGTLPQMIEIAERLGQDLDFVRIDLYDTTRGVLLGEMTVYPNAGMRERPSGCPVLDQWLGAQWSMGPVRQCAVAAWNILDWASASGSELMRRMRDST